MMATQTENDVIYMSPWDLKRPRGRPLGSTSEKKIINKPESNTEKRSSGRPKLEVPLTPEELTERRRRYKSNATELKKDYDTFYQQCYYQRPEVKQRKTECKRKKRSEDRELRNSQ